MIRTDPEKALQSWAQTVLSPEFDGGAGHTCYVIYSDQGGPKLKAPFATLLVFEDSAEGSRGSVTNKYDVGTDTIDVSHNRKRSGTVTFSMFGENQAAMARRLENSKARPEIRAANKEAGLVVAYVEGAARRQSVDSNNVADDRTIISFKFRYADVEVYNTAEFVETANIEGSFNGS